MKPATGRSTFGDLFAWSTAFALALSYVELLKAHRTTLWAGAASLNCAGVLVGFFLYAVSVAAVGAAFLLAAKAARRAPLGQAWPLAASIAGASMVWFMVTAFSAELRPITAPLLLVCMVLYAAIAMFFAWVCDAPLRTGALELGLAILSGTSALVSANHVLFLEADRVSGISLCSVVWLIIAYRLAPYAWKPGRHMLVRKRFITALIGIGLPPLVAGAVSVSNAFRSEANDTSLVLLTCDALRADCTSLHGGPVATPAFEALAERGVVFDQCHALAPWTLPSMLGMLSSSYPQSVSPGVSEPEYLDELRQYRFPSGTETLAELLQEKGYATAAFIANPLLYDPDGLLRGFDRTELFGFRLHVRTGFFSNLPVLQDALMAVCPAIVRKRPADTTRVLTAYATEYVRRHRHQPFFLWVHYMDPHGPYDPPDRFRRVLGDESVFCPSDPYWDPPPTDEHGDIILAEKDRTHAESLYRGEVQYVDEAIGQVVAEIEKLGIGDRTVICVTSDHGEEFWDHGRYGHGQSLFNELTRVPLIITGPGIAPCTVAEPVSALDVVPTLACLVGVEPQPGWRGQSLADMLRGEPSRALERPCFTQATNPIVAREPLQTVVAWPHKLIRGLESGFSALYNIEVDPTESTNLSAQEPQTLSRLTTILEEWSASFPSTLGAQDQGLEEPAPTTEVIDRMRDTGYL